MVNDIIKYLLIVDKRGIIMGISYRKLWVLLAEKEISKQEFRENLGIASGTMTKLNKGQEVALSVLLRICEYFHCDIGDICEAVEKPDKI